MTLIGLRFRQVHSSFATFVVVPTLRGHTVQFFGIQVQKIKKNYRGKFRNNGQEMVATKIITMNNLKTKLYSEKSFCNFVGGEFQSPRG